MSDTDTEETLARLKEDIMTIYATGARRRLKPNTTVEERQALKELKENFNIMKPSDKCKGFVILDREINVGKAKLYWTNKALMKSSGETQPDKWRVKYHTYGRELQVTRFHRV